MRPLSRSEHLDLLTLSEPLACVIHAYKRLPDTFLANIVTIFGAGPIGSLHIIEARRQFPNARIQVVDVDELRRSLLRTLFPFVDVFENTSDLNSSDLTVVATSNPSASLAAMEVTSKAGVVLLFSGIDHSKPTDLPEYGGIDLEAVHRNEEIRVLPSKVRLIGSSGYHRHEIDQSVELLSNEPHVYAHIQTGLVEQLEGTRLNGENLKSPAILELLLAPKTFRKHLKLVFRVTEKVDQNQHVVVIDDAGSIQIREFSPPELKPNFVRVKVLRFSICQTDRRVLQGTKAAKLFEGLVLGHEGVGIVEAVGKQLPQTYVDSTCIILPHYFQKDDELDAKGIGFLSKELLHLGIHINGCFSTSVDLPYSCVHPIDLLSDTSARQINGKTEVIYDHARNLGQYV